MSNIIPSPTLTNLPTIGNHSYNQFDIVANVAGRYFDYKRDSKIIKAKRKELKYQADISLKQIDAELKKSIDSNQKNYNMEMHRLSTIAKELKHSRKDKKKIINVVIELTKMLLDPSVEQETKQIVPDMIRAYKELLEDTNRDSNTKLSFMYSDTNNKKIEE